MRIEEKKKEVEYIEILEDVKISQEDSDIILEKGDRIVVLVDEKSKKKSEEDDEDEDEDEKDKKKDKEKDGEED